MSSHLVLVLDGVPDGVVEALGAAIVIRASSPCSASGALSQRRPDVVIADANVAWQRLFLGGVPEERRPAVIAHGDSPDVRAAWADEWIPARPAPGELALRLRLARERAQQRRQRSRRALIDPLTRLPNRRAIIRSLVREGARARRGRTRLALVLIDLDGFKRINDSQGHDEGDRVLRRVGGALLQVTREEEVCGRIGGDEFAIVLDGDREAANRAAVRATKALEAVGVAATVATGELRAWESLRELYRRVDEQLRTRKRARHEDRGAGPRPAEL